MSDYHSPSGSHGKARDVSTLDGDVDMGEVQMPLRERSLSHKSQEDKTEAMVLIGQQSRGLINTIQQLETLDINATISSLPKFVVVGDQSAGKSSVIEATCDINLPRSSGTCTRCPFQITTTASKDPDANWSCEITLSLKYHYNPLPKARRGQTSDSERLFSDWMDNQPPAKHNFGVCSKTELEPKLRLAQLAILCPDHEPEEFLDLDPDAYFPRTVQFSPNLIELHITAPDLPELSVYDLPGAINVSRDEKEQHLVEFVEKLMRNYLQDENSLVLLACAADQDLENSTAFRFIRESQATQRTMGVLTKPDLMTNKGMMLDQFRGQGFHLGKGWFVTKQLSQGDVNRRVQHSEARAREVQFFQQEPWTTDFAPFREQMGTASLQRALSLKLTEHILASLPRIMARVTDRIEVIQIQLRDFPSSKASPGIIISRESEKLKASIKEQTNAESSSTFRARLRSLIRQLVADLKDQAPTVELQTPGYQPDVQEISEGDETTTPRKRSKPQGRASETTKRPKKQPGLRRDRRVIFTLDGIKALHDAAPAADLPQQLDPRVIQKLSTSTLQGLPLVVDECLMKTKTLGLTTIHECVDQTLNRFERTPFHDAARQSVQGYFEKLFEEQHRTIRHLNIALQHRAITYDPRLTAARLEHLEMLQSRRATHRRKEDQDINGESMPVATPNRAKVSDLTWVKDNLGIDEYQKEVDGMATPLAYYDIACSQMVDTLTRLLEYGVFSTFENEVYAQLLQDLHFDDELYCANLLVDDPMREQKRLRLIDEKDHLERALEQLRRPDIPRF